MNYSVVATKIDPQTKKEAQKVAFELGVPLSVLIKGFLKQLIRTKTVTFSVDDEIPNAYLQSILKKADEDIKKGNVSPKFTNAKDAIAWLNQK